MGISSGFQTKYRFKLIDFCSFFKHSSPNLLSLRKSLSLHTTLSWSTWRWGKYAILQLFSLKKIIKFALNFAWFLFTGICYFFCIPSITCYEVLLRWLNSFLHIISLGWGGAQGWRFQPWWRIHSTDYFPWYGGVYVIFLNCTSQSQKLL